MSIKNTFIFITYGFPGLLAFLVIDGRINQHAIVNVNAAVLSRSKSGREKGNPRESNARIHREKRNSAGERRRGDAKGGLTVNDRSRNGGRVRKVKTRKRI